MKSEYQRVPHVYRYEDEENLREMKGATRAMISIVFIATIQSPPDVPDGDTNPPDPDHERRLAVLAGSTTLLLVEGTLPVEQGS